MAHIQLKDKNLNKLRTIDQRYVSYNVEMTEVTGGTFWKEYTPEQIAGMEEFPPIKDLMEFSGIMQWYDPIDLYDPKLRKLAAALGPTWIRVSGSWATKTYFDLDDQTGGTVPEGYQSVLTKAQWIGVLEFVKAVGGKLLVSVSNCDGDHPQNGPIMLDQTKKIFDFSARYGVPIDALEFMNEPNMLFTSGAPKWYTAKDYVRDHDIVNRWVREHYPDCLLVGPCSTGDPSLSDKDDKVGAGLGNVVPALTTKELMDGAVEKLDVYSYHCYNGISERIASVMPDGHWQASQAHTTDYLAVAEINAKRHIPLRDLYVPGGQMWITESGDAGGGGDTWASTYLEVLRMLNELGSVAKACDGIVFHNTLASSDYGWLRHSTFDPRPSYFAVLLWSMLMGTEVYDSQIPAQEGAHVYCHSRKDGKPGYVYLIINNSLVDTTTVELPKECIRYTLCGNGDMRNTVMYLNGTPLALDSNEELPVLEGIAQSAGVAELAPGSCTFVVI